MAKTHVGVRVYIDNHQSVFHGREGIVTEIGPLMVEVDVAAAYQGDLRDRMRVWFSPGELRFDRQFSLAPKQLELGLRLVEDDRQLSLPFEARR